MGKYIHYFDSVTEYNDMRENHYEEPWTSLTEENDEVNFNKTLEETPLTFEITGDGNIVWKADDTAYTVTLEYKLNDGDWTEITSATGDSAPSISVVSGDTVQFRAPEGTTYTTMCSDTSGYNNFNGSTAQFSVKGNIMSLLDGTNFSTMTSLSSAYTFSNLFESVNLTDASNLILPATTLTQWCYQYMFRDCDLLTTAPALPATILAPNCYYSMFQSCWLLTTAPELPATTLAESCYNNMFYDCRSLTTAPSILPATTLANDCYSSMFDHCNSLTSTPTLPATTLAEGCYYLMFYYCASLTQAPELPATTLADYCYFSMFDGCASLTQVPELPATTLADSCYFSMFDGCASLTQVPELPATTLADSCYSSMFQGCTGLTTAPALPATTLTERCYYHMFSGCTNLNYIKCLATDISASNCTNNWVYGVAASGTFVAYNNTVQWTTGNNGIPTGWTTEYEYSSEPLVS